MFAYPQRHAARFATAQFRHLSQFCEAKRSFSRSASLRKQRSSHAE
jgi:hypothetical protein